MKFVITIGMVALLIESITRIDGLPAKRLKVSPARNVNTRPPLTTIAEDDENSLPFDITFNGLSKSGPGDWSTLTKFEKTKIRNKRRKYAPLVHFT
jgi:hypothetical protein